MAKKVFGASRGPAPRKEFTMTFRDKDEKHVPHDFRAVVRMDAAGLKRSLQEMRDDPETGLTVMFDVIAGQLDDSDGVSEGWTPQPYGEAGTSTTEWPTDDPNRMSTRFRPISAEEIEQAGGVPADAMFAVPYGPSEGKWLPWSLTDEYTTHVAGSSRRRWVDLIENHNDLGVELDDVQDLFQWLISLAANRPT